MASRDGTGWSGLGFSRLVSILKACGGLCRVVLLEVVGDHEASRTEKVTPESFGVTVMVHSREDHGSSLLPSLFSGLVSQSGAWWRIVPGLNCVISESTSAKPSWVEWMVVGMLWRTTWTTWTACWRLVADGRRVRMAVSSDGMSFSRLSVMVSGTGISRLLLEGVNRTFPINALCRVSLSWSRSTVSGDNEGPGTL